MKAERARLFISRNKDIFIALLICLITLVTSLILHPVYETIDDEVIEALLFGYQDWNGTPFLVYVNSLLGMILYSLVSVFPKVNWYYILQFVVCLVSLFVIILTLIRKHKNNGIAAGILIAAAGMETLYIVQYTKTAAFASLAGTTALIYSLREPRHRVLKGVCIGLILIGSMLRFEAFEMELPFLAVVACCEVIDVLKKRRGDLKRYILVPGLVLCMAAVLFAGGKIADSTIPGSKDFIEYNYNRTMLTDYPVSVHDGTDTDVVMIELWMNNDPEVITPERVEQLKEKYHIKPELFSINSLKTMFSYYFGFTFSTNPLFLITVCAVVVFLIFSRKRLYGILLFGCYFMIEWYLTSMGRIGLYRVDYGILLGQLTSLVYLSEISMPKLRADVKNLIRYVLVPLIAVMGICFYRVSWHIYERQHNADIRKSFKTVTSVEGGRYIVHPLALGVNMERNLFGPPTDNFKDGFFYTGGWWEGIAIPGTEYTKHTDIEGNPWKACVDSDSIRLVFFNTTGEICINAVTDYIGQYYGTTAEGILEYKDDNIETYRIVSVN